MGKIDALHFHLANVESANSNIFKYEEENTPT